MTIIKRFDRKLYEENDKLAKVKVKELFKSFPELTIIENPKKRDVDLLVVKDLDIVCYIECEHRTNFKSVPFPYDTVNIPERKNKYCVLDKPTIFITFSDNWDNYLAILGLDVAASPLKMSRNKYISFGENFYSIPLDKVVFNDLKPILVKLGVIDV